MKLPLLIQENNHNKWPTGTLQKITDQINETHNKFHLYNTKPPCTLNNIIAIVKSAEISNNIIIADVTPLKNMQGRSLEILHDANPDFLKIDSMIQTQPDLSGEPKLLYLFIPNII